MGLQSSVNSVLGSAASTVTNVSTEVQNQQEAVEKQQEAAAKARVKQLDLIERQKKANQKAADKLKAKQNQKEAAKTQHENFLAYSNKIKQLTGKEAQ